jgi:transcriptional regulator with XRE-family HTH domain
MLPTQCKMSRSALGWGVRELATKAKISVETVVRFENGEQLRERTIDALRKALEKGGVVLIAENGRGPGVRLKKRGKR